MKVGREEYDYNIIPSGSNGWGFHLQVNNFSNGIVCGLLVKSENSSKTLILPNILKKHGKGSCNHRECSVRNKQSKNDMMHVH